MSRPASRLLATTSRHMARLPTASAAAGAHAFRSFTQTCLRRADADPPQPPPERTTLEATPGQKERGQSSPPSSADPATRRSILDTPPPKPGNASKLVSDTGDADADVARPEYASTPDPAPSPAPAIRSAEPSPSRSRAATRTPPRAPGATP